MPTYRVQHSLQGISGTARDQFVNTFHFLSPGAGAGSLSDLADLVVEFYEVQPAGVAQPPRFYLSANSDSPGAKVKIYDLSDPLPRTPVYERIYTPIAHPSGGQNLPNEVAVCLSYAADHQPGVPISSQRGRIYIGPLNDNALGSASGDTISRPLLAFRETLVAAGKKLQADAADILHIWSVHSPTQSANYGIVRFWCDDAWDTQRRRGERPTSRVTATI